VKTEEGAIPGVAMLPGLLKSSKGDDKKKVVVGSGIVGKVSSVASSTGV